jgi:hypothetical protein
MEQFSAASSLSPPPPLDSPTDDVRPFDWETILRSAPDDDGGFHAEFTLDDLDEQRIDPPNPLKNSPCPAGNSHPSRATISISAN